ncbi:MAG: hypothetical protein HS130_00885 [Deltaproteobacteria bacterium]|nr:hypothetical protein [Deltaproteobacteria bacterium]MCL4873858.1 hypothetical protein [bacterium]
MAIVSYDPDELIEYMPEYGGNRESEDPCVVRLRFVPYSKVQAYSRQLAARCKGVEDREKIAEITHAIQKKQFCDSVESVSGYFIKGREVTKPEEFYATADTDLVVEILRAMESQSRLTGGQRKN